jgi:putative spermidine/putrescine transport system ATP-binding protein
MERTAPGTDNAFDALVDAVEYGGHDSLLRVQTAFGSVWARSVGEFTQGERISLRVPPSRVLVYDAETA